MDSDKFARTLDHGIIPCLAMHPFILSSPSDLQVAGLLDWISAAVRRPAFGHPANADDSTGNKDSCSPRLAKEPTAASSKGAGSAGAQGAHDPKYIECSKVDVGDDPDPVLALCALAMISSLIFQ